MREIAASMSVGETVVHVINYYRVSRSHQTQNKNNNNSKNATKSSEQLEHNEQLTEPTKNVLECLLVPRVIALLYSTL